jgi:hypothetical protein
MHMTQGYLDSALNIAAATVQVKVGAGKVVTLVVSTGGTATLFDSATTGGAGASNQIASLGAGSYQLIFPFFSGLVVTAAGAPCSVAYE